MIPFKLPFVRLISLVFLSLLLSGCATTANTGSPYETNAVPSFSLKVEEETPKTVYIRVRNTSRVHFLHIAEAMAAAFEAQNYTIVNNPNEAYYIIHATLPQAGEITELQQETLLSLGYGKITRAPEVPGIVEVPAAADTSQTTVISEAAPVVAAEPRETFVEIHRDSADDSPLLYSMTLDMQISIRKNQANRLRYQVRLITSMLKTETSFQTVAPELSKALAEGVVEIFEE